MGDRAAEHHILGAQCGQGIEIAGFDGGTEGMHGLSMPRVSIGDDGGGPGRNPNAIGRPM
ncbi:hypothetical protein MSZK_11030 [Mycobacterium sp. shizuoka-1]|nr:hypothetical protein MSZK_11030 [Mycobacterium sp. shizuoka-1]